MTKLPENWRDFEPYDKFRIVREDYPDDWDGVGRGWWLLVPNEEGYMSTGWWYPTYEEACLAFVDELRKKQERYESFRQRVISGPVWGGSLLTITPYASAPGPMQEIDALFKGLGQ